ncbi:MAG: tRNA1(Val) (adenine(37)-N6)-methyltransferase [Bacteroidales bacterium]
MGSFLFKKFTVRQQQSAMKVNTDGVLLPAWVNLNKLSKQNDEPFRVLDIGTGTGVIALIIAQRLEKEFAGSGVFEITGIDIDEPSSQEAAFNFSASPWAASLISRHISLQNLIKEEGDKLCGKFSLILSNPPYFTSSLKAPGQRRSDARHNDILPFKDILRAADILLKDNGVLALVLPVNEGEQFIEKAGKTAFKLLRICRIKTLSGKKAKRVLMEFSKGGADTKEAGEKKESGETIEEELIMQEKGGEYYSHAYCSLVGDYYLKLFKTH